jgi:CBS domain-containing protein
MVRAIWERTPFGIFRHPELGGSGRWILLSASIGVVAGIGAILFDLAFRLSQWALLESIGRFRPPAPGMEGGVGFPPQNVWLLPLALVIGALVAGAIVFGLAPEAEGHGTDAVIDAFHRKLGKIRRRVPIVKAIASAITIGSGGSAGREGPIAQIGAGFGSALGDFLKLTNSDRRILMMAGVAGGIGGPSLVIGGALGAAFGKVASDHVPGLSPEPVAALMVGMGGFFAGVAKVPFTSVIMVMEMTGSYGLLVPSLLVATMAYLFLPRSTKLYENQVATRLDSPVHERSFATDVLKRGRLGDSWDPRQVAPRTVREDAVLADLVQLASENQQAIFPVVDGRDGLVGEISVEDVRRALLANGEGPGPRAVDIMRHMAEPLLLDDDLAFVARKLAAHHADAITVVRGRFDRTVVGIFGRRDLIVAYGRLLQRLHAAAELERAAGDLTPR